MNKKLVCLVSIVYLFVYTSADAQKTISGITVPATLSQGGKTLVLNGVGVREKYFIDLYVGALYLESKSSNAKDIINADRNMAIKLYSISSLITKEKMEASVLEGFKKSTGDDYEKYATQINQFVKAISEDIKKGDIYEVVYQAESDKVKVYKNDSVKTEISGLAFKKILFGIWLGDAPADSVLKEDMLGD